MPLAHMGAPQGRPASLLLVPSSPRPTPLRDTPLPAHPILGPAQPLFRRARGLLLPDGGRTPTGVCSVSNSLTLGQSVGPWLGLSVLGVFSCADSPSCLCLLQAHTPVPGCRALCGAGPQGDCGSRNAGRVACAFAALALSSISTRLSSALCLLDFALCTHTHSHGFCPKPPLLGLPPPGRPLQGWAWDSFGPGAIQVHRGDGSHRGGHTQHTQHAGRRKWALGS